MSETGRGLKRDRREATGARIQSDRRPGADPFDLAVKTPGGGRRRKEVRLQHDSRHTGRPCMRKFRSIVMARGVLERELGKPVMMQVDRPVKQAIDGPRLDRIRVSVHGRSSP